MIELLKELNSDNIDEKTITEISQSIKDIKPQDKQTKLTQVLASRGFNKTARKVLLYVPEKPNLCDT